MSKRNVLVLFALASACVSWLLLFFMDAKAVEVVPRISLQLISAIFLSMVVVFLVVFNRKAVFRKAFLRAVMSVVVFVLAVNVFVADSAGFHMGKQSKTTLDYFLSSGGRKMESVTTAYSTYLSNLGPVFFDMFEGKQVVLDNDAVGDPRVRPFQELIAGTSMLEDIDPSVTREYMNENEPQIIRHYDTDKRELDILIYTGRNFESAKKIYIKKIDEWLVILPQFLFSESHAEHVPREVMNAATYSDENTVILELKTDVTIERVLQGSYPMEMSAYLLLFFISGLLVMLPFILTSERANSNTLILVSFFAGVLLQVFSIFAIGAIGLRITTVSVLIVNALVIVLCAAYVFKRSKRRLQLHISPINAFAVLLVFGVVFFFSVNPSVFLSYDSYMNILIGKRIAALGSITSEAGRLAMFSLMSPLLHAHASIFGVMLSYALQPVMTVLGLVLIVSLQARMLLDKGFGYIASYFYSGAAALAVFTVPEVVISADWVLNNLTIGILYGLAVLLLLQYRSKNEPVFAFLSIALFLYVAVVRIEGGVFALIFLTAVFVLDVAQYYKRLLVSLVLAAYLLINLFYYFNVHQIEEGFWSLPKAAGSLGLIAAFACLIWFERYWNKYFGNTMNRMDAVMIGVLVLGIAGLAMMRPEKAIENIGNLYANMFVGYYGILFIGVLAVVLLSAFCLDSLNAVTRLLSVQIIGFILLMYFIMLLSMHSSRIGYGDSSCRMLLHILPLCSITMVHLLSEIGIPRKAGG